MLGFLILVAVVAVGWLYWKNKDNSEKSAAIHAVTETSAPIVSVKEVTPRIKVSNCSEACEMVAEICNLAHEKFEINKEGNAPECRGTIYFREEKCEEPYYEGNGYIFVMLQASDSILEECEENLKLKYGNFDYSYGDSFCGSRSFHFIAEIISLPEYISWNSSISMANNFADGARQQLKGRCPWATIRVSSNNPTYPAHEFSFSVYK